MIDQVAELRAHHADALVQRYLFTMRLDELESITKVSVDEMQRWSERGLLSFNPRELPDFEEHHRIEVEFVGAVVRSGLADAWVDGILGQLRKPYCYDPNRTFYSFAHHQWVTLPIPRTPEQIIDQHLSELADGEDWSTLEELRDHIEGMLPQEEDDEQGR